jgi:hypothetical protein
MAAVTTVLPEVGAILTTTPPRWLALTDGMTLEALTRPPVEGEWSAVACLRHLLDTERSVFPVRVRAFLAGADFPAFDPNTEGSPDGGESPRDLAAEFARLRAGSLALIDKLRADDLARTAHHPELGPVTLGEMLHEWAAHDLNHTVQAERALMRPFIAACGPWRPGFADHDVSSR